MKSKIGYDLLGQGADPIELIKIARPAVVLCMKLDAEFGEKIRPYCGTIVWRKFFDEGFQTFDNPKEDARKAFNAIIDDARRLKHISNLWMVWNESAVWNPQQARKLRDFYNEVARLFHIEGFRVGAYSFPEGNPELGLWRYLLDTDCDYIFLHEYDYPTIDAEAPWHVGRWTLIDWNNIEPRGNILQRFISRFSPKTKMRLKATRKPIIITEGVLDGKVRHKDGQTWGEVGWQHVMSEDRYVEELKKLDARLQADPNMEGLCLFADEWDRGDRTYNHNQSWKVAKYIGEESVPNPTIVPDDELARLCINVGFPDPALAMAIILAESGGNPNAVNVNNSPGKAWDKSKDQGLVQFNEYWFWRAKNNRRVSDWVAFNPIAAITSFYWATGQGKSFSLWSSYNASTHVKYLARCKAAVERVK